MAMNGGTTASTALITEAMLMSRSSVRSRSRRFAARAEG
jgi:hypothetical protein